MKLNSKMLIATTVLLSACNGDSYSSPRDAMQRFEITITNVLASQHI